MFIQAIATAVVFFLLVFLSYRYGKSYLTTLILAFYSAYYLLNQLGHIHYIFLMAYVASVLILFPSISSKLSWSPLKRWIDAFLLALGITSQIIIIFFYLYPDISNYYILEPLVKQYVTGVLPYHFFVLLPFVSLAFTAKD